MIGYYKQPDTTETKIRKLCLQFINTQDQIAMNIRSKALIKSLNVARRVIKNLQTRPDENKCKVLKNRVPLLQ
jgi:hypothetical protein